MNRNYTRSKFPSVSGLSALTLATCCTTAFVAKAKNETVGKPNFIIFLTDDKQYLYDGKLPKWWKTPVLCRFSSSLRITENRGKLAAIKGN